MVAATLEARCEGSLLMSGMIEAGADSSAGGDGGIRTLDRPLQAYNGLANRRLQPLGHVSNMPGMPDTAASRKRQNQGLCVLSPESDRRTTAKAWRKDQRGTRSRFALSIYVCIQQRDCRIRHCGGRIQRHLAGSDIEPDAGAAPGRKAQDLCIPGKRPVLCGRPGSRAESSGGGSVMPRGSMWRHDEGT